MAAEEAGRVRRTPACLCVLCGLPAAGKSTLSRIVCSAAARRGWRSAVVQYDDLIPEHAFHPRGVEEDEKLQEVVMGCWMSSFSIILVGQTVLITNPAKLSAKSPI